VISLRLSGAGEVDIYSFSVKIETYTLHQTITFLELTQFLINRILYIYLMEIHKATSFTLLSDVISRILLSLVEFSNS